MAGGWAFGRTWDGGLTGAWHQGRAAGRGRLVAARARTIVWLEYVGGGVWAARVTA